MINAFVIVAVALACVGLGWSLRGKIQPPETSQNNTPIGEKTTNDEKERHEIAKRVAIDFFQKIKAGEIEVRSYPDSKNLNCAFWNELHDFDSKHFNDICRVCVDERKKFPLEGLLEEQGITPDEYNKVFGASWRRFFLTQRTLRELVSGCRENTAAAIAEIFEAINRFEPLLDDMTPSEHDIEGYYQARYKYLLETATRQMKAGLSTIVKQVDKFDQSIIFCPDFEPGFSEFEAEIIDKVRNRTSIVS